MRGDFLMYCPNCGSEVMEDAKFCPNCGLEIKLTPNGEKRDVSSNERKSTISSEDVGKAVSSASAELKKGAIDFKNEWSTWSTRKKFLSVIACCCIGWILISVLGGVVTPDKNAELFDETNEGRNITLVKESTEGYAYYSSGEEVYSYSVSGVFINIPKDSTGFTVKTTFLDEDGKKVGTWDEDLDYFEYWTENSEPDTIGFMTKHSLVNVSDVEIVIFNPMGEKVFNQTLKFNMDEFDLSRIGDSNKTVENSSD